MLRARGFFFLVVVGFLGSLQAARVWVVKHIRKYANQQ